MVARETVMHRRGMGRIRQRRRRARPPAPPVRDTLQQPDGIVLVPESQILSQTDPDDSIVKEQNAPSECTVPISHERSSFGRPVRAMINVYPSLFQIHVVAVNDFRSNFLFACGEESQNCFLGGVR